jgi:hypothetical protein
LSSPILPSTMTLPTFSPMVTYRRAPRSTPMPY